MKKKNASNYDWYHQQWGKPTHDDRLLFILLTVGTFQVGLSWKVAAGKLPVFLKNFHNMEISKVAAMLPDEVEAILQDPEMIRNPRKVQATIQNARAILAVQEEYGSFAEYMWDFVGGVPRLNVYEEAYEVPNVTPLSKNVAKDMKRHGFTFVGPVVTYMFMKASGMIQDEVLNPELR
ncbi:DNA-3-methyladenine glycosylase I [Erwinia sp. CPCC 100877]|nr:DNA-3-methyladenine glycosylase I [Erwinia sp. CPCC 100877]